MIGRFQVFVLLLLYAGYACGGEGAWSGSAGLEWRGFPDDADAGPGYEGSLSLDLEPIYTWNGEERAARVVVHPFLRIDQRDAKRTHVDFRNLYAERIGEKWEGRVGFRTVNWGVTESQHLVDIINQTDLAEWPDGEDKLGQPMVDVAYIGPWGTIEGFLMPYFRERTFVGKHGRPRSRWAIDTDDAEYDSGAESWHPDLAVRYSQSIGAWDLGLSHFWGTSREPRLIPEFRLAGQTTWNPYYDIIHQSGVDVQYTRGPWIWKAEAIHRSGQGETFNAVTAGFEYSFHGVGLLAEWLYDDRGDDAPTPFENDLYLGIHAFLSDVHSTDLRFGATIDPRDGTTRLSVEASRGLGGSWRAVLEGEIWVGAPLDVPGYPSQGDSVVRVALRTYF